MGHADYFKLGSWNALCSICGFKFKADELTRNWQGLYRCDQCQEQRQPQDFVRAIPDRMNVPWAQKPAPLYVNNICTFNGMSAIPGLAMPGCSIPGRATWDQDVYPAGTPQQVLTA
jgi:hypothetical protein